MDLTPSPMILKTINVKNKNNSTKIVEDITL